MASAAVSVAMGAAAPAVEEATGRRRCPGSTSHSRRSRFPEQPKRNLGAAVWVWIRRTRSAKKGRLLFC